MQTSLTDIATSAFAGLPAVAGRGSGVLAAERDGLGIARVAARKGQGAKAAELLRAHFGIEAPNAPRRASLGELAVAGIAPQIWLATRESAGHALAQSLQPLLGPSASIADQSDMYAILRLGGPRVRATLAKVIPIDVHARSFQVNDLAQTVCGHVSVTLWRLEDTAGGEPQFEVWAGRSLAVSLHQAIAEAAAEFGFIREPARNPAAAGLEA